MFLVCLKHRDSIVQLEAGKSFNKLLCGIGYESSHMHLKLQELIQISFISKNNQFYIFKII